MAKKIRTNISIDDELLEKAKKQIPNLSAFVEECLKHYLGLADGMYPVANASELLELIGKTQAELFILNQNNNVQENLTRVKNHNHNKAWNFLWHDYKRRLIPNNDLLTEASKVTGVDEDTLEEILDYTYEHKEELGLNFTWEEAYQKYRRQE